MHRANAATDQNPVAPRPDCGTVAEFNASDNEPVAYWCPIVVADIYAVTVSYDDPDFEPVAISRAYIRSV